MSPFHMQAPRWSLCGRRRRLTSSFAGGKHRIWSQSNLGANLSSASPWPLVSLSLRTSSVERGQSIICLEALLWDPLRLACDNHFKTGAIITQSEWPERDKEGSHLRGVTERWYNDRLFYTFKKETANVQSIWGSI